MHFLYAVNNFSIVNEKILRDCGIYDIIPNPKGVVQNHTMSGPGMKPAVILWAGDSKGCRYKPEEQVWAESLNKKFHIGYYASSPPTPAELARDSQIPGHEVETEPGIKWKIPLARVFPVGSRLPKSLIMGADGKIRREDMPKFAEFSAKAEQLWKDFTIQAGWQEGKQELTYEDEWRLATMALGFNYHVGPDEINALKLFNDGNFESIVTAIVDVPTFMAWLKSVNTVQKKKKCQKD